MSVFLLREVMYRFLSQPLGVASVPVPVIQRAADNVFVERPAAAYVDVICGADNPPDVHEYVPADDNELPSRPLTVFFNPRTRLPAPEVFEALQEAQIDHNSVSCVQRQSSSKIVLTFRNAHAKEQFLAHNVVKIRDQPLALQDIDRPLTYLQIFDAPHEIPDATIIQRLSKYCDVLHHRRGYFCQPGWEHVQDGVRHYRVRIKTRIPNFIRFGKLVVHVRYKGQPRTCRHCHQWGHYVNACHTIVCYNCEETGHLASDIPTEILCNICKQPDHRTKTCPFSQSCQIETVEEHDTPSSQDDLPETSDPLDADLLGSVEENDQFQSLESLDQVVDELSPPSESMDQSTPSETLKLFTNTDQSTPTAPKPQCSKSVSRRPPAQISSTVIPSRTPTQPVLVTGKTCDDLGEDNDNSMNIDNSEQDLKRKHTKDRPRTNKHKKHK